MKGGDKDLLFENKKIIIFCVFRLLKGCDKDPFFDVCMSSNLCQKFSFFLILVSTPFMYGGIIRDRPKKLKDPSLYEIVI